MDCPICKGTMPSGGKRGTSALMEAVEKLSKLPDAEVARICSIIDILYAEGGMADSLTKLHARVERLEQGLAPEAAPVEAVAPVAKKSSRKRGAKKPDHELAKAVAEELAVPLETVKERQARMTRMEKEERMKARAIARQAEQAAKAAPPPKAKEKPEVEAAAVKPPKKRPRRRRRRGKGGASIPADAAMPA